MRPPPAAGGWRRLRVSVVTALMALVAVYFLVPLVWVFLSVTKNDEQLITMSPFSVPSHVMAWQNVGGLFRAGGGIFAYWLGDSFGYAIVVSLLSTYLSGLAGFAVAKLRFTGRRLFAAAVVASLMVPSAVLVVPVFILESRLHITNSYEGVILPQVFSAFAVFFMTVYLRDALPDAVLDAARIDGASQWRVFHRIVLPMARPGLVTLVLVSFVATWNNYFLPLVLLTNEKLLPVTVGLADYFGSGSGRVTGIAISVLPTLVLFPFLQRYVGRGLLIGAVAE